MHSTLHQLNYQAYEFTIRSIIEFTGYRSPNIYVLYYVETLYYIDEYIDILYIDLVYKSIGK